MAKNKGRLAYETMVEAEPLYANGTKRPTWDQLNDAARESWDRKAKADAGK